MKIHVYLLLLCSLFPVHCRAQKASDDASLTWAQGAVWYQIFPERFRNGWTGNDPIKERVVGDRAWEWHVHPWTADWYKMQDWEKARSDRFYDVVFYRRFGGDLVGVVQKLDYLKELGIDAIYFNPIFEAPSLHKYDATTYHHVDNNFGYNREGDWQAIQAEKDDPSTWSFTSADSVFLDLIVQAHKRNIKIVIDGVFNHCGDTFWAFRDVVEKQQKSRYRSWFDVTRWDDPATPDTNEFDYKSWWGFKAHPEFREDENGLVEPVKRYIFNITKRWMDPNGDGDPSDGIDGWRLDVIQDVAPAFWEEWYRLVKSINPDAITIGEIWDKAPDWIQHKRID
ncbi:MAG: alpha-amylase, partial [Calditrichaeota bacterium]